MANWLIAISSVIGALAAAGAWLRSTQTKSQVTPSNGDKLSKVVEAHIEDDKRSLAAIRVHLQIPPDDPEEISTEG